jgi:hypothetical protein
VAARSCQTLGRTKNSREMPILCKEHGTSEEAFICRHLLEEPAQFWCSREPTSENPCPDAWCLVCDKHFEKQGEWNDQNEGNVPIKLICQGCYKRLRLSDDNA